MIKSKYNRKDIRLQISYVSQPQQSRFAKSYSSYSGENYLYLYAYTVDSNGEKSNNDLSYHAYSNKCDMNKKIQDFTKYIRNNFSVGDVVNAHVVEWKQHDKIKRMITEISPAHQSNPNQIAINAVTKALQKVKN